MKWSEEILINIHGNINKMMPLFKTLRKRIKLFDIFANSQKPEIQ